MHPYPTKMFVFHNLTLLKFSPTVFKLLRLQGDNLADRTEDMSQILHSPDEIIPDSLGKV